jgi:hypothetical protein
MPPLMWLPKYARQILCELEMICIQYAHIALYRTSDLIENRVSIVRRMWSLQPGFPTPQVVTPSAISSRLTSWRTGTIFGRSKNFLVRIMMSARP